MERDERTGKQRSPGRILAIRVALLAVTVGAVVAAGAAVTGAGGCSAPTGAPDVVCFHLVRTLAGRVGIATGLVTAILTLTVVGLSRLVTEQVRP